MSYTLTIATREDRDLIVAALRQASNQRTRVARQASGKVAADKRAGKDVRSASVKVTALLAEADVLEGLADELAATRDVPVVTATPVPATLTDDAVATSLGDDGTSVAAQAIAELAGLTPADPDAVEDPLTGALPEDAAPAPEEILKP